MKVWDCEATSLNGCHHSYLLDMTSKQPCIKRESSQPITLRKCILLASVSKKSILLAHPNDRILGGNNQIYNILLTAHTFKEHVNLVALVAGPSTLHKTLHWPHEENFRPRPSHRLSQKANLLGNGYNNVYQAIKHPPLAASPSYSKSSFEIELIHNR